MKTSQEQQWQQRLTSPGCGAASSSIQNEASKVLPQEGQRIAAGNFTSGPGFIGSSRGVSCRTKVVVPILRRRRMDVGPRAFGHRGLNDSSSNDGGLFTTFEGWIIKGDNDLCCVTVAQKLIGNILARDRNNAQVFVRMKHGIRDGVYGAFSDRQPLAIAWRLPNIKPCILFCFRRIAKSARMNACS